MDEEKKETITFIDNTTRISNLLSSITVIWMASMGFVPAEWGQYAYLIAVVSSIRLLIEVVQGLWRARG